MSKSNESPPIYKFEMSKSNKSPPTDNLLITYIPHCTISNSIYSSKHAL